MKLTPKQERFCQEYMSSFNGKQSAIKAGYNENTAAVIASENLIKPNVVERLAELSKDLVERTKLDQEELVEKLKTTANFRVTDMITIENGKIFIKNTADLPDNILDNIVSITQKKDGVEVKFSDRQKAIVDLGRYFGMFVDRLRIGGDLSIKVDDFTDANYQIMCDEARGKDN